jgi:hypothetical protein
MEQKLGLLRRAPLFADVAPDGLEALGQRLRALDAESVI